MKILGATPSPFFRKVVAFCEEKGIAYERKDQGPFPKTPELLAMHPMGKIPILEHDGSYIPDSSVICAYLERLHPEPALYPADPKAFARALFLEEYADTKMVEGIGPIFFERFVKPNVFQGETDEAVVAAAIENDLPGPLDYIESQLPAGGGPVLGEISIADLAIGAQLGSLSFAKVDLDTARWPKVAAYREKLIQRPSFQRAMALG